MSSCLTGGGRAYILDLEIFKTPSNSWTSNSSSPSSTLSESSNSQISISTRKARTPRKRPNQTYHEAAAILSTAYPKLFPTKHLTKPHEFTKSYQFQFEQSDLLPLLETPFRTEMKLNPFGKFCQSPSEGEINSKGNFEETCDDYAEDFDAESILDEEIDEGIDSIMGDLKEESENCDDSSMDDSIQMSNCCFGYPVGLGFEFDHGLRREFMAIDEKDWWRFPTVNFGAITKQISKIPVEKKKKKKKKQISELNPQPNTGLRLNLNYDDVLNAWSDKGSPFTGDVLGTDAAGGNVQERLSQINLFSEEDGGERSAIVLRYKEKRRTRGVISNKIRYQVRKVSADQRPRIKGRFVRKANSQRC